MLLSDSPAVSFVAESSPKLDVGKLMLTADLTSLRGRIRAARSASGWAGKTAANRLSICALARLRVAGHAAVERKRYGNSKKLTDG